MPFIGSLGEFCDLPSFSGISRRIAEYSGVFIITSILALPMPEWGQFSVAFAASGGAILTGKVPNGGASA
jgi:hypothetical protein